MKEAAALGWYYFQAFAMTPWSCARRHYEQLLNMGNTWPEICSPKWARDHRLEHLLLQQAVWIKLFPIAYGLKTRGFFLFLLWLRWYKSLPLRVSTNSCHRDMHNWNIGSCCDEAISYTCGSSIPSVEFFLWVWMVSFFSGFPASINSLSTLSFVSLKDAGILSFYYFAHEGTFWCPWISHHVPILLELADLNSSSERIRLPLPCVLLVVR